MRGEKKREKTAIRDDSRRKGEKGEIQDSTRCNSKKKVVRNEWNAGGGTGARAVKMGKKKGDRVGKKAHHGKGEMLQEKRGTTAGLSEKRIRLKQSHNLGGERC